MESNTNTQKIKFYKCHKDFFFDGIRNFTKDNIYEVISHNSDGVTFRNDLGEEHSVMSEGWLKHFSEHPQERTYTIEEESKPSCCNADIIMVLDGETGCECSRCSFPCENVKIHPSNTVEEWKVGDKFTTP